MSKAVLEFFQDMDDTALDLGAYAYLLRLMEDYGERCDEFPQEVKERAITLITGYHVQMVNDLYRIWFDRGSDLGIASRVEASPDA